MLPASAPRTFQAPAAREASCGRTTATPGGAMIDGSSVVTGTLTRLAWASAGSPARPATIARSAASEPGSGIRTVSSPMPSSDETTSAWSLVEQGVHAGDRRARLQIEQQLRAHELDAVLDRQLARGELRPLADDVGDRATSRG